MAYELLAGQPPFVAANAQRLLVMHIADAPRPLSELRPGVPPALAALVMACLEKEPERRPQNARALLRVLDELGHPDTTTTAPALLADIRKSIWRALALYAGAFVAVAVLARAAIALIGLPDWVFPGALVVMALGLPVILLAAYAQHIARHAAAEPPAYTPGGTAPGRRRSSITTMAVRASPHLGWRRVAWGGVAAVALFALAVAAYMTLRALGIGPAGSLFAAGSLAEHDRLLLTDFASPSNDTTLGSVVAEALRTDLGQSPNLTIMQSADVREVLRRMQRPATSRIDLPLAREIATREGLKAVVDGDVLSLGGRYQISVRLVNAQTGDQLASFAQMAPTQADILPTIDRLTRDMRAKIGESLRAVRAAKPLEQVTTSSLEALRKYVQAVHALEVEGDLAKGTALLDDAIALDTGFAMAYRKYAMELGNRPGHQAQVIELLRKAYEHRARLTDAERYLTEASYWDRGPEADIDRAIQAYEAVLDLRPDDGTALNNVGIDYVVRHDFPKAEAVLAHAVALPFPAAQEFGNLANVEFALGKTASAERLIDDEARRFPANPAPLFDRAAYYAARGEYDSASAANARLLRAHPTDLVVRALTGNVNAALAAVQGHLAEHLRWRAQSASAQMARGVRAAALNLALDSAFVDAWYRSDSARALEVAQHALAAHPLDSIPPIERPYVALVTVYSLAGRPDRARAMAAAFDRVHATLRTFNDSATRSGMRGEIALAEHRYADAAAAFRAQGDLSCPICGLPQLAQAYDLSGESDSALVVLQRYVDTPWTFRLFGPNGPLDARYLAGTYKRLGELYEARGDRRNAETYYSRFLALWKNADPDLQPIVAQVRTRLERLRRQGPS